MEADHKSSCSEDVPCTDTSCKCSSTTPRGEDDMDLCGSEAVVPVAACSASQEETNMKKLFSKLKRSDGKITLICASA